MKKIWVLILFILFTTKSYAEILNFSCVNSPDRGTHEFIKIALDKNKKSVEIHYKWNSDYYNKYSGTRISSSTPIEKKYLAPVKSFDNSKVVYTSLSGKGIYTFYYGGNLSIENSLTNGISHRCIKAKNFEIAEKPKKQEPQIIDYRATVLNSDLVLKNTKDSSLNTITFYPDETAFWKGPGFTYKFFWKEKNNRGHFSVINEEYKKKKAPPVIMKLDFQRLIATFEYPEGDSIKFKINKPNKPIYVAEKPKKQEPKKEKPKTSPDDNKIVPAGSGSGFFVLKDGTVITNYHVIEGCELNKVSYKGSQSEAKVLSIDKVNDIAILKTNIKPQTAFAVSNEDVSLLEDVVVAGYPLGKQISSAIKTHKGVVTALAGAGDNYSYFQTDAAINQGNSGGPIINQKGNVVGIAVQTWIEEGVQGVHFGIKSSTLKTFANANGLKFLTPNNRDLSNKELGKLITESTVYVECHMTVANIKKMLDELETKKSFYKKYK